MLSKKLWEARRVIERAAPEVRERLLEKWLVEAQQCYGLEEVSMLYSVLPWEQYSHLGYGVMLLYMSSLFGSNDGKSRRERVKCRASVKVRDDELNDLVRLGSCMMVKEQLEDLNPSVKRLLDRIVSSPYFNAEQPGSLVLDCVDGLVRAGNSGNSQLQDLSDELASIYTPTEELSVFGYLSWEQVNPGALTSLGNQGRGRGYAKMIAEGVINVEEKVKQLQRAWSACLAEMNSSHFVKQLLTTRPPKSTVPHSHALLDCIEHTWLWMISSNIDVYSTVPGATYSNLSACDEGRMYGRFEGEVLPRGIEKTLRRMAIEAYLMDVPEPNVDVSAASVNDPYIRSYFEGQKSNYIARGFREGWFPAECSPWVARDSQDLDNEAKMKRWLWNEDFLGVHLHHELLRAGGVDDDDLLCLEKDGIFNENDPDDPPFDTRRDWQQLGILERISPLDEESHKWAPDFHVAQGVSHHKIREVHGLISESGLRDKRYQKT